jgi:hypothetical protein
MCVILANIAYQVSNGQWMRRMRNTTRRHLLLPTISGLTAGNSALLAAVLWSAAPPALRISAAKAMSIADNFLQKQQKQRGYQPLYENPSGHAEMAGQEQLPDEAEALTRTADFDRLLQMVKSPARPNAHQASPRSRRIRASTTWRGTPAAHPLQVQRNVI